jgi:hypothetical protein
MAPHLYFRYLGWQRVIFVIRGTCVAALAIFVATFAVAAPQPPPRDAVPILAVPVPLTFSDLSDLLAYIAQSRGLGSANDPELSREIGSGSSVQQLHDYSSDPILVVKADLLDHNGKSRLRSPNGNYPFYVARATPDHLVLMGMMFGTVYSSHLEGKQLHFEMQLNTSEHTTRAMSFLVDDNALVNLSAPLPPALSLAK